MSLRTDIKSNWSLTLATTRVLCWTGSWRAHKEFGDGRIAGTVPWQDMRYALFSSGGKDSLLALDRARRQGLDVSHMVNIYEGTSGRVRFHGVRQQLIVAQAQAVGLSLIQKNTHPDTFEQAFGRAMQDLKEAGVGGILFGNIHLADIRAWYEERTTMQGFKHIEPLWGDSPSQLIREFVSRSHRARVVSVYLSCGRREWLGRDLSGDFITELERCQDVDVCGERGEYHTFAFGGPLFQHSLELRDGPQFEIENHLILDFQDAAKAENP